MDTSLRFYGHHVDPHVWHVVAGSPDWSQLIVSYTIGPIIGGLLAWVSYTAIALTQQERLFGGRLVDTDVPPGSAEVTSWRGGA